MDFNSINTKTILVATNYLYNSIQEFEQCKCYKKYEEQHKLNKITPSIIGAPLTMPPEMLQQMVPVTAYKINEVDVSYSNIEKVLATKIEETSKEKLVGLSNIFYEFLDSKISDISALGINFISQYNLGNRKLKVLNQDIDKHIIDFKKNKAFQVTLLLEYDDCNATYKIRKYSGGDNTGEPRIYQIDVNMHFDMYSKNTQEKINLTSNILNNLEGKYYKMFNEKCNQILEMSDEV